MNIGVRLLAVANGPNIFKCFLLIYLLFRKLPLIELSANQISSVMCYIHV